VWDLTLSSISDKDFIDKYNQVCYTCIVFNTKYWKSYMPQISLYVDDELSKLLDAKVAELCEHPGIRVSRSSVTAAALRAFLMSGCIEKDTKDFKQDSLPSSPRSS
jgi:hypothetical protein